MRLLIFLISCLLLVVGVLISENREYHVYALNPFGYHDSLITKITHLPDFNVNKTYPLDGQLDVKLNKKISVMFNGKLNTSSLTNGANIDNFRIIKGGIHGNISNISSVDLRNTIKGKYSVSDNNQIVLFSPDSDLAPNALYTVLLFGKDNCRTESNTSDNKKNSAIPIEEHDFVLPNLINPTSNRIESDILSNNTESNCALRNLAGNLLDQNYAWSFTTLLSPPIISKPHDNSSSNNKAITISGADPNHSDLVQLFRISDKKENKLKEIGSAIPSRKGDWSIKVDLDKLDDGSYQFVAKAFDDIHNRSSDKSEKLRLIVDTKPPLVKVPSNIVVKSSQSDGSLITFQSNATDNLDGTVKTSCSPFTSGDIFPLGSTKVTCKAIDKASNEGLASFNANVTSASAIALTCNPNKLVIIEGSEASIDCVVENRTFQPIDLNLSCSKLDKTGIKCYINGNLQTARMKLKEQSSQNFQTLVSSKDLQKISPGVYPFTISANCEDHPC